MEVMGTWEMQNICVAGYSESCWTDRLQKRGLPHPERCPLRSGGKNSTLLISCVFARQFWYAILQPINLSRLTPTSVNFADWWKHAERRLPKQHRKGFNSLCILGAWILWKHRNACVFEGASVVVQAFKEESHLWQFSGAKKLTALSPEMGVVQV